MIALIAALVGLLGAVLGVPLYLIDGEVDDLEDTLSAEVDTLEGKIDALDDKLSSEVDTLEGKIDTLDDKIEARFAAQDTKIDARFAAQDARFSQLENGQAEIDRKLTALIASLGKAENVEAALEGRTG